jgi:TonB-linked SusC/RagA family outer membrane protein
VAQITFAQERAVSGTVSDNTGMPLPGVSVLVKGTKSGTQTDFDGKYSIKATSSQVLIFSYIGMKTQEVKASSATVNVKMASDAVELEGVVVSAFGLKKQKRSVSSATSVVTAKDLTEVTNTNVFESLSGKVAGVDITAPAQVGAASKVVIRGYNSLSGSSPLYVVDGSPIGNGSSSGTGNTRSYDAGNGIGDIDPNNIENITILKGAAASALYGSRASNGVILITTKSAKNNSKLAVEIMTSTDFSEIARVPHLQNEFGQGWSGKSWSSWSGSSNTASNENGSWGPAFNGEVRVWGSIINSGQQIKPYVALENNVKEFYETGNTFTNDVRVSGGGEKSNFSLYFSDVKSDGIIPTEADEYKRRTLGLNGGITEGKLTIKGNVTYVKKDQNAVNTGQGADAGEGNVLMQELLQVPRDISIVDLEDYKNNPYNSNSYYFSPYTNNPYWSVKENATIIDGNRFYGNANILYKIDDHFSASYQLGGDYRSEKVKSYGAIVKFLPGSPQALAGANEVVGGVTERSTENLEYDSNLILNYSNTFSEDYGINALIGYNANQRKGSALAASITNLDIPYYYELSNSSIKPIVGQSNSERKSYSLYASVEASYKNFLYLTLTGRNDWTSTLPEGNNSYFYPSAAISGVVIDNTDTFLKLRASYAELGNDTAPYQTESTMIPGNAALGFGNILLPIGGVNGYEFAGNLGNEALKPERTTEYEVGFESTFFKKRVNLDLAVYNKSSQDVLWSRPLPTSTGYGSQTANIIDLSNEGIEIALNLVPVRNANFQWDFTTTFTKNNSEVTDIAGDTNKQLLASNYGVTFNAVVGQPLGVFSSPVPLREGHSTSADGVFTNGTGAYIVDAATGFYKVSSDEQIIGTSERDFIMGFNNRMTYKNLVFTFGLDWKEGGEMYSYTKRLSHFTGNGIETTYNDRNPFIIPNSVIEVVDTNGNVTGYKENTKAIGFEDVTDFYNTGNNPGIENTHVIDKTFVRLRSVSLTYNFPSASIKRMGLQNASLSLYGKNLGLWTPESNPYIDPELSTFGTGLLSEQGEFAANPTQRTYGASIKLTF